MEVVVTVKGPDTVPVFIGLVKCFPPGAVSSFIRGTLRHFSSNEPLVALCRVCDAREGVCDCGFDQTPGRLLW
ncbi:MAG: hypothetical protein RI935_71 [Candidatus Parcubacteria bacterium]|jgi:hypothetical protein